MDPEAFAKKHQFLASRMTRLVARRDKLWERIIIDNDEDLVELHGQVQAINRRLAKLTKEMDCLVGLSWAKDVEHAE